MDSSVSETSNRTQFKTFCLSWVAYIRPVVVFFLLTGVGSALVARNTSLGVMVLIVALLILIYRVMYLRSMTLFTNQDGVWSSRGIMPWNKGIVGVKWRDVEDAVYFTGFFSWALKSYSVRIGHRFTKSSELLIRHVKKGDVAVAHINEMHQSRLGDASM